MRHRRDAGARPATVSLSSAPAMARALWKTGLARQVGARGLLALGQARLRGPPDPSLPFRVHAASRPDQEAVVDGERRLTYGHLARRIDRLAAGLEFMGASTPGSTALLVLHNRFEVVELQAALASVGARIVPVSWRSRPDELAFLAEHADARAIFVDADVADQVIGARPRLHTVRDEHLFVVGGERPGLMPYESLFEHGSRPPRTTGSGGVVMYTSGTTGTPKGAARGFSEDLAEGFLRFLADSPLRAGDRHLAVGPMYHSTAFAFVGFTLALGGTVIIERRFDPERFLALVERELVTTTAVVPTMLFRLLGLPDHVRTRHDSRSLRAVLSGGAPLPGGLARRFMEAFGLVLYNFYGSTETGINTLATPEELLRSPGTVGHEVPGNEIRLLDDDGRRVRPGETGEVFVRNSTIIDGYHADMEATHASMRNGFFGVGDLGHQDEHGLFHIDGRKDDMIVSGGVNVYPAEVEEVLRRYPAVEDAAVVGVPDEEWGERVNAFLELAAGAPLDEAELTAWARQHLAGPKVPRELTVVDRLPRNPTGKVLKHELRTRR